MWPSRPRFALGARARLILRAAVGAAIATLVLVVALRATDQGWPLAESDDELVSAAGLLLFVGLPLRTAGWRRLIAGSRPGQAELLAANGAAYLGGTVLPSQLHAVVKAAVLRRLWPKELSLEAIAVSLVLLSLVDAAALVPLTLAGTAWADSAPVRAGLAAAALAGLGAGALLFGAGRLAGWLARARPARVRTIGRVASRTLVGGRDLRIAAALLCAFWLARAFAALLLLQAMGLDPSLGLALGLVSLSAVSAALPLGLLGAAAQVGTVAAVLVAAGVDGTRAVAFGLALSLLVVCASSALGLLGLAWRWRVGRPAQAPASAG